MIPEPLSPSDLIELEESLDNETITNPVARGYVARLVVTIRHIEKREALRNDVTRVLGDVARECGQMYADKAQTSEAALFLSWSTLLKAVSSR